MLRMEAGFYVDVLVRAHVQTRPERKRARADEMLLIDSSRLNNSCRQLPELPYNKPLAVSRDLWNRKVLHSRGAP